MQVTDISGRGVGMDAVRSFLEEMNCSIEIEVDKPASTTLGLTPAKFVITIPSKYFQFIQEV